MVTNARRVACLLLIIIVIILASFLYLSKNTSSHIKDSEVISTNRTVYGEVVNEFLISGFVKSSQQLNNSPILFWNFDPNSTETNHFRLRIWNVSEVLIRDTTNGTQTSVNYSLNDREMVMEGTRLYFICNIKFGQLDINFSNFSTRNAQNFFIMNEKYSSIECRGELNHQSLGYLDFQVEMYTEIRIGNELIKINHAQFSFPIGEFARFELLMNGRGYVQPTPNLIVNGTIWINDFRETSENGKLQTIIRHLKIQSTNIMVTTRQEPYCDVVNNRYVYDIHWAIKIQVLQS